MKILQIIDTLNAGGAERMCVTVSNLFHSKGHTVTVLELVGGGVLMNSLLPGIPLQNLHRKNKWNVLTLLRLAEQLRLFDVIHVHMRHVYRYVFLANLIARKKLVLHDHGNYFPASFKQRNLFRILLKNHVYIAVGTLGYEWAKNILKLSHESIFMLANIVNPEKTQATSKLNKIVLVSNIKPGKNIKFIIPFARKLFSKNKQIEIDVVGGIIDHDYFQQIRYALKDELWLDRITFLTNETSVQSIIGKYKLGLHFSEKESGPLVLLEYLAQGLPFVSFLTGDIAHKISGECSVFFLHNFDAEVWSERVNDFLENKIQHPDPISLFSKFNDPEVYYNQCLSIYKKIHSS